MRKFAYSLHRCSGAQIIIEAFDYESAYALLDVLFGFDAKESGWLRELG